MPIKVYDETIRALKTAVQNAKLGRDEEMQTLKRLDDQPCRLEQTASGPSFEDFVNGEVTRHPPRSAVARSSAWRRAIWRALDSEMNTRLPRVTPLTLKSTDALALSALLMKPRNAQACSVFAHGAGAGMTHPFMEDVAAKLYGHGIATLPPSSVHGEEAANAPTLWLLRMRPYDWRMADARRRCRGMPIIAGGKSFGGRRTSRAQAEDPIEDVRGLAFVGFPLTSDR